MNTTAWSAGSWFQHHQPGAYIFSAAVLALSGQSFVRFRLVSAVMFFLVYLLSCLGILRRLGKEVAKIYLALVGFLTLAATYFWGQMVLADTISLIFFLPAYTLTLLSELKNRRWRLTDVYLINLLLFASWVTSLTLTYTVGILSLYILYRYVTQGNFRGIRNIVKRLLVILSIIITPYFLFFAYWWITGSLQEYIFANFTYNQEYYIYNYPRSPGAAFNPLRYAVIISQNFFNNYYPALSGILKFPLSDPLQTTLAVGTAGFVFTSIIIRRYLLGFTSLLIIIFISARINPQAIKSTDYQSWIYVALSLLHALIAVWLSTKILNNPGNSPARRLASAVSLIIIGTYLVASGVFLAVKLTNTFVPKYMGTAPLIYDRPEVAPLVNRLTSVGDYAWIGPFSFKELFYLNAKVPSKHHWFLNHAMSSDKIRTEILSDFTRHQPLVVVFNRRYAPWGGDPATYQSFFTEILDRDYFRICQTHCTPVDPAYRWIVGDTPNFKLDSDFNFLLSRREEIIIRLIEKGMIEKR